MDLFGSKRRKLRLIALKIAALALLTFNFYFLTNSSGAREKTIELNVKEFRKRQFYFKNDDSPKHNVDALRDRLFDQHHRNLLRHKLTMQNSRLTSNMPTNGRYKFNDCNYMNYSIVNDSRQSCDLLITVKTTNSNYNSKLKTIINTWYRLAPSKVGRLLALNK